jgi:hypothetical protein
MASRGSGLFRRASGVHPAALPYDLFGQADDRFIDRRRMRLNGAQRGARSALDRALARGDRRIRRRGILPQNAT